MTTTDDEIVRLRAEVQAAEQAWRYAEARLNAAILAASPFKVGDVVEASIFADTWQEAIVREVRPLVAGEYWYKVSIRTKSGAWARFARHAFDRVRLPEGNK